MRIRSPLVSKCFVALPHGRASDTLIRRVAQLMDERDFFNEKQESKRASFVCPSCRERSDYDVRWMTRRRKQAPPRGANEMDRARFAKSRDYMVRIDDLVACPRFRKRCEIPMSQSDVFI